MYVLGLKCKIRIYTNGCTYAFYYSNGSLKADVGILATINTNTTSKSEAINYLINGIDVALGKHIKGFILLGKQIIKIKSYVLPFKINFH